MLSLFIIANNLTLCKKIVISCTNSVKLFYTFAFGSYCFAMKKYLLILLSFVSSNLLMFGQMKVVNGHVGIGQESYNADTLKSIINVGGKGSYDALIHFLTSSYPTGLFCKTIRPNSNATAISGEAVAISYKGIGVMGAAAYNSGYTPTSGVGVRGITGGGSFTNCSYGISGLINGGTYGAAVYGGAGQTTEPVISGQYAAYFNGNAMVNNGVMTATVVTPSDLRLKQKVQEIEGVENLSKLLQLNPVTYQFKQTPVYITEWDSLGNEILREENMFDTETKFFQKQRFGLIAQELQEQYPNLVYTRPDGYLAIDYVGIIPLLLKAIQTQQAEIEQLKKTVQNKNEGLRRSDDNGVVGFATNDEQAWLKQNVPNPFDESTQIQCFVPSNFAQASIHIYNLNGTELKEFTIENCGQQAITVDSNMLPAGIYLYSLIVDNVLIDTKRMILTK